MDKQGGNTHLCSRQLTEAEFSTTASELHIHQNDKFLDELAMLNKRAGVIKPTSAKNS